LTLNPYRDVLRERFDQLDDALRTFHAGDGRARGEFDVAVGAGLLRRAIARSMGFRAAARTPVTLSVVTSEDRQEWRRTIGDARIVSTQWADKGLLLERIGWMCFAFELDVVDGQLRFRQRRAWLLGVPLPRMLQPVITASAHGVASNAWIVAVEVSCSALGLIARYGGRMEIT
jgi:hypothetical protein